MQPTIRSCLAAATLAALATSLAAQHVEFDAPWMAYDTATTVQGYNPWSAAVADFDGDGIPDLATANWANATASVLFGDGRGGFGQPVSLPVADASMGICAADLDGDGDQDLAVANTGRLWDGDEVTVLRNRGDGTFEAGSVYPAGVGPVGIAAADLDGDGDLDLAVSHDRYITAGNTWGLLRNQGGATFAPAVVRSLPSSSGAIATGDLNGDGRADVVIAGEYRDLSVLLAQAGGGFATPRVYSSAPTRYLDQYPTVALGDVDLDGDLDVLASAERSGLTLGGAVGQVGLLRNAGDGSLGELESIPLSTSLATVSIAVGDVDGDGWPDLAVAHGTRGFGVVPNDGAGGFGPMRSYLAGESVNAVALADLEADGDADVLAVSAPSRSVAAVLNPGDGAFAVQPHHDLTPSTWAPCSYSEPRAADLDADGDLDIVIGYSENFGSTPNYGLAVARNRGDGTYDPSVFLPAPILPVAIDLGDIDGDGDVDVAWMDDRFPTRLRWRLNDGAGNFGPAGTGPSLACEVDEIALADVDGNGRLDALTVGCSNDVQVSRWVEGSFAPFAAHALSNFANAFAVGDVDMDGVVDLVTNSGIQAWVEVSLGNGDGTFGAPATFQSGFGVQEIAIADFDGDGFNDVATMDSGSVTMTVLINRGVAGLLKPPVSYHASPAGLFTDFWYRLVPGDVDYDGDVDLMVGNYGAGDVSLWRNRGDGTFDPQQRLGVGDPAYGVMFGDFDGDGVDDVAVEVERSPVRWYYPALVLLHGTGAAAWTDLGQALAGTYGAPELVARSVLRPNLPFVLAAEGALEGSAGIFVLGTGRVDFPLLGGTLVPSPDLVIPFATDPTGTARLQMVWPAGVAAGIDLFAQAWVLDAAAPQGLAATNAVTTTTP